MEPGSSTGRALARAALVSLLVAGLIPSALSLVRKASMFGRADVLLAPEGDGLRVHRVGPSAAPSGLLPGDLLLLVDGTGARSALEPAKLFAERTADVVLLRDGAARRLRTTPAPAPWDFRYLFLFAVGGAFLASALAALRPAQALARGSPLRGIRALGRLRPHAHAGAPHGRDVPRRGPRRRRGARGLSRVPARARPHVPAPHPPRSRLAAVRARGGAPRRDGARLLRPRRPRGGRRRRARPRPDRLDGRGRRTRGRPSRRRLAAPDRPPHREAGPLPPPRNRRRNPSARRPEPRPAPPRRVHPDPLDARAAPARARTRRVPRRPHALPPAGTSRCSDARRRP